MAGYERLSITLPLLSLAFFTGLSLGNLDPAVFFIPLLSGIIAFGIPHGAVDFFYLPEIRGKETSIKWAVRFSLYYLALGIPYLLLWLHSPPIAILASIAFAIFHWGEAEMYHVDRKSEKKNLKRKIMLVLARGSIPMIAPLIFFPGRYLEIVNTVVGFAGAKQPVGGIESFLPWITILEASLITLSLSTKLFDTRQAWKEHLIETSVLLGFFSVVPPIFSGPAYFSFWHSFRHSLRYLDKKGYSFGMRGWKKFYRDAWLMSILSLPLLLLIVFVGQGTGLKKIYISSTVIFLTVLAFPHTILITYINAREDIW